MIEPPLLGALIEQLLPQEGIKQTGIPGLTLFRRDQAFARRQQMYDAQIIILAQGRKEIYLADETYRYDAHNYVVVTVPLPVECEAFVEDNEPILGLALSINAQIIGELIHQMDIKPSALVSPKAVFGAPLSQTMDDVSVRLLSTLHSENDKRVLGPLYFKEVLYRVLTSKQGELLQALASHNRGFAQVARAIHFIHQHFDQSMSVQSLAEKVGMSATSFYNHFKAFTDNTPLQYIKSIRLHKARALIQEGEKANSAALQVGYESASQFSREYKRAFGSTPAKGVAVDLRQF